MAQLNLAMDCLKTAGVLQLCVCNESNLLGLSALWVHLLHTSQYIYTLTYAHRQVAISQITKIATQIRRRHNDVTIYVRWNRGFNYVLVMLTALKYLILYII